MTEKKCEEVWKMVLVGKDKEAQKHFIGNKTKYSMAEVEEAWEMVVENIYDIGYENVVEEDCANFANRMKEALKEIRKEKKND